MAEMLLINPRRRRKNPVAKRRARRRNPVALAAVARRRRRRNPIALAARPVYRRRRRNPVALARVMRRRRRNPIGGTGQMMTMIRDALMGGAGAVVMDLAFGQIKRFLPAQFAPVPGQIGVGDAVKAVAVVVIGNLLNGPTRGFSRKAAQASLTVQAHDLIRSFVPSSPMLPLGYATPARVAQGTNRVGPVRSGMNAYVAPGPGALLNAYVPAGQSPLLSGARAREGVLIK